MANQGREGDLSQAMQARSDDNPIADVRKRKPPNRVEIGCFAISAYSRTTQFIICTTFIFIFYIPHFYIQELIFRLPGFQPFGASLTLIQFGIYSILAIGERKLRGESGRKIPLLTYAALAFYTVGTMACTNASVGYLNYPTQVVFKSCKLLPVLIGGILIQGKRFGWVDVLAACCMSLGLILFTLADNKVSPNVNIKGYILIMLALTADAALGNVQEKAIRTYSATNSEVVLYSFLVGCGYIFIFVLATGELFDAMIFFARHPVETYGYAALFSIAGYLGINVVLTLVREFDALLAVTVTTCRKTVTIFLSFVAFTKPFTIQYVWSGLIVLLGIYLNMYAKHQKEWNENAVKNVRKILNYYRKNQTGSSARKVEEA